LVIDISQNKQKLATVKEQLTSSSEVPRAVNVPKTGVLVFDICGGTLPPVTVEF
jgi:hypothetical protein